ncbi:pentatricopeptide repeat-containing protein At1g03540-like [Aristolochia californica]|uniref:pentatricopeptide repeat-containing protein At1g03540-like n=1 Tax=Aristolochia californica TaxID=171875 RepID=UPI0035DF3FA0
MVTLLASSPQPFQNLNKLPYLTPPPKLSFQRFPASRFSTSGSNHTLNVSSNDWPFEQRMREALDVLELMKAQGMNPEPSLFCTLLRSCADEQNLEIGKVVHAKITEYAVEEDAFVANNLIYMYSKCGDLRSAQRLFDEMPTRNTVSWTSVISMYNQFGHPKESLRLYRLMKSASDVKPNGFTYATVLDCCAKTRNLKMGMEIHEDVIRDGFEEDGYVITALIDTYAKCGKIDEARKIFNRMTNPTFVAYTAMIEGYNINNRGKDALDIIRGIFQLGIDTKVLKELGFGCMIRSCILEAALRQGQEIHCLIIKFGFKMGVRTLSSLILLYAEANKMAFARHLFEDLVVVDMKLWHRMISGYVKNGMNQEAWLIFSRMLSYNAEPDQFVFSQILSACDAILNLDEVKQIHAWFSKGSCGLFDASVRGNLVNLYCGLGEFEEAQKLRKWQCKEVL